MTKLRKFFASSVMVMTVVVMSGLAAPVATKAAAQAGDLIKKDGLSAVYYLGQDGKRYVFPNEATYKSWYNDFSGVVTVSADELANYPLGANVVVRPGTYLVKITTDPKVYAVEGNGVLRWVQTETDAKALYGENWAKRVIDVADSFFTNYTIGKPLASGEIPAGSLVQKSGESNIYYYDGSDYRLIEDEVAFSANRFRFEFIVNGTFAPSGSNIIGAEADIIRTSQGGTSTGLQPGQGTGVTVSLNSMTPASQSVPQTVGRIPFAKVNLTASADGIAYVDAITVTRSGLTSYSSNDFKVWAEKDGTVVASKRALTSNDNVILNFSPVLTIPAGQTVTLDILAEVSNVTGNGALGITSASAISASGSTVSGSFPIVGNTMSFANYDVTTVTFATSTVNSSVKIGDEEVELASFGVVTNVFGTATTTGRDTILKSLTLRNGGAEDLANVLMNVRLENNGEIVSNNATFNGRYLTFTFKNGGFEMLKEDGGSETFTIKADVIGKDSLSENSIELRLYKSEDFYAYEKATGFGVKIEGDVNDSFGSTKIESGAIDIAKKSTNPSNKDVIKGAKDEVVLLANIKADEVIKTDGIDVQYLGDKDSFQNAKVYLNNVLLGSFDLEASTLTTTTIDSSLNLNKGNNELKITVDVKTTASSTKTFTAKLTEDLFDAHNPEYVSSGNAVVYSGSGNDINGSADGATLTVSGGALTFTRNDGYTDGRKVSQGSNDVVFGKFAVKATNDTVKLTSISLSEAVNGGVGATTSYSHIYDMKLFVDGVQLGSTRNFTSGGSVFSSLNYSIAQNTTKVIELRGSLTVDAAGTATTSFKTTMTVNAQDSLGKTITPASTDSTARFEVTSSGKLTVAVGADTPGANILVAKAGVEQEIAQYTLTSEDDSSNVTEIVITNATTTSPRINSYKLYLGSTLLDTAIPVEATTTFYITNNKLLVNTNESKTISLKAVLNPIEVQDDSNKTLVATIASVKAKSSAGQDLTGDALVLSTPVSSKTMTILKTKPTFTHVSNATGGASKNQELLRFSVSADANEDLNIRGLVFDLYGTGAATATGFKLHEVNGDLIASAGTTTATTTTSFASLNIVVGKGATKTFRVTGNTSLLTNDATFGIALDNAVAENISWGEKFVNVYTTRTGANLASFPIDGGTTKY